MLGGAAAVSIGWTGHALAVISARNKGAISYAVFDSRFPQSIDFAQALGLPDAQMLDVAAGLTRLWQNYLVPHWRKGGGVVVGLTTLAVWDGLSQQAIAQFRRPANIARHHLHQDERLVLHRIGRGIIEPAPEAGERDWPQQMACLAQTCALQGGGFSSVSPTGRSTRMNGQCHHLATWMIR